MSSFETLVSVLLMEPAQQLTEQSASTNLPVGDRATSMEPNAADGTCAAEQLTETHGIHFATPSGCLYHEISPNVEPCRLTDDILAADAKRYKVAKMATSPPGSTRGE